MKDFTKVPTDAAMIKAFKEFEHAFNVADAMLRLAPERAGRSPYDAESERSKLVGAHRIMHNLAARAEERKEEAKK